MNDERRIDRMAGCSHLGKLILGLAAVVLAVYCVLNLRQCGYITNRPDLIARDRQMIKSLHIAIQSYILEYNGFPVPGSDSLNTDVSSRSRGPMLSALNGVKTSALNPRAIMFIEFPMGRDRKYGIWQDGTEWVLSDSWGEPYYFVLDTKKDDKIANPEFGADQSDPAYAKRCQNNPPLPELKSQVIIYSSGPDRDPKTWHDNICSWR